jgi:hypothetical protein
MSPWQRLMDRALTRVGDGLGGSAIHVPTGSQDVVAGFVVMARELGAVGWRLGVVADWLRWYDLSESLTRAQPHTLAKCRETLYPCPTLLAAR